ncbi:hypothetical protein P43SY_000947 [Pythium insidiosum]|uniref:Uncharacterized protein n=1 Tax=Pythium insidiosum TaxID=114742 RepID=A0AAD5LXK2_PYTIN|nr:hypothetical protein P43SY_000947 [Pythium insidiosum]
MTHRQGANDESDREIREREQIRHEVQALALTPRPAAVSPLRQRTQKEQQMRRRHGRPPYKHIENSGKFVDEHAFSPVESLRDEHQRKKQVLCRRLLHVKGETTGLS